MSTQWRMALIVAAALVSVAARSCRADCKWPPVNAVVQKFSASPTVGGVTFTTGSYTWMLASYQIENQHCDTSINWGPRSWWIMIGLGGEEPVGVTTGSSPGAPAAAAPPPPIEAIQPLPALAYDSAMEPLQELPPLPPTSNSLTDLPPLAPIP